MSTVSRLIVDVELDDGTVHSDLRIKNPALVAYDLERAAKKWPDAREAPLLWQTFIAWRQLKNDGLYAGDFRDFRDSDCVEVTQVEVEEVDPTKKEDDSSPSSSSPPAPALASTG